MKYHSTLHKTTKASLLEACTGSVAADGGLYMPERIPALPSAFFNNFAGMQLSELAYVIANTFFGGDVESALLKEIVEKSFNFPIHARQVDTDIFVAELFHGPTLSCKDFGARFMARLLRALLPHDKPLHVVVTTNGNTGSAVAHAFSNIPGVDVHVLYPKGKLSRRQENEFATLGGHVHAIEVQGTLDDCKALEHMLLADKENIFGGATAVTANSLNISRLLPQVAMCFGAIARVVELTEGDAMRRGITVAIPCGNLGGLAAALMAHRMGLPVKKFIAATGGNDTFHRLVQTGQLSPLPTVPTLSYALDGGSDPVNLPRVMELCGGSIDKLRSEVMTTTCSDVQICETINNVYARHGYLLDPNTAVAWHGALKDGELPASHRRTANSKQQTCLSALDGGYRVIFATAHPAKSLDAMTAITSRPMELPLQLMRNMGGTRNITKLPPTVTAFRRYLAQTRAAGANK